MNKSLGFTLIELLVVVLIIGILSAVALPQYTLAVEKSRLVEAQTVMKYVHNAMKVRYLECGGDNECMYQVQDYLELQGGEWDGPINYKTKHYTYDFDMQVCAHQNRGDYNICSAGFFWEEVVNDTNKGCEGVTDLGKKICRGLEKDGYDVY